MLTPNARQRHHRRSSLNVQLLKRTLLANDDETERKSFENYRHSSNSVLAMAARTAKKFELDSMFYLEASWMACTKLDSTGLAKRELNRQEAIWELITTELHYLKTLRLLVDLFFGGLKFRITSDLFKEIDLARLFANIREVYHANLTFWHRFILPLLTKCRDQQQPLTVNDSLAEAFINVDNLFHPYIEFCSQQAICISYAKQLTANHEHFRTFLNWAESQKQCERQKLVDLLVVPMQRLTKYALLLNAILKETTNEDETRLLNDMIVKVEAFVSKVNEAVRCQDESLKLMAIACRIEGCDYLEMHNDECSKILECYSEVDILSPSPFSNSRYRSLLYEGTLRVREGQSKIETYSILLTDMLLITKTTKIHDQDTLTYSDFGIGNTNYGLRLLKPPIRLDKVEVRELRDGQSALLIVFTDFQPSVACSYIIACDNIATWVAKIRLAQSAILRSIKQSTHRHYAMELDLPDRSHSPVRSISANTAPASPTTPQKEKPTFSKPNRLHLKEAHGTRCRSEGDLLNSEAEQATLQNAAQSTADSAATERCNATADDNEKQATESSTVQPGKNNAAKQDEADAEARNAANSAPLNGSSQMLPQINILSDTPTSTPNYESKCFDFNMNEDDDEDSDDRNRSQQVATDARRNRIMRVKSECPTTKSSTSGWRRGSWSGRKQNDTIECLVSQLHSQSARRGSDVSLEKNRANFSSDLKSEKRSSTSIFSALSTKLKQAL